MKSTTLLKKGSKKEEFWFTGKWFSFVFTCIFLIGINIIHVYGYSFHGVSRSASLVISYLQRKHSICRDEALRRYFNKQNLLDTHYYFKNI